MKTCSKCHRDKELGEFFFKSRKTGRLNSQCKDCYRQYRSVYFAEHYRKYGDAYRARARVRHAKLKQELQKHMLEYLQRHPCIFCGETDIRTLEFDHINPENKSFGIAKAITDRRKWSEILAEINKCRVLCANCHKKRTAEQHGWYKNIKV